MISTELNTIKVEQISGSVKGDIYRFNTSILRSDGNECELMIIRGQRVLVYPFSDDDKSCISIGNKDIDRHYVELSGVHYKRDYAIDDWLWKALVVGAIWASKVFEVRKGKM